MFIDTYNKYIHKQVVISEGVYFTSCGVVADVDPQKGKARVKLSEGNTITDWIPLESLQILQVY